MAKSKINGNYTISVRRKRQKKTNYKRRLAYIKSGLTRLVIRPTTNNVNVQLVNYSELGDEVLVSVNVFSLRKIGWKYSGGNIPSAYLCGLLIGKSKAKGITDEVIVDLGLSHVVLKSRLFAVVKGAKEAGLNINVDDSALPPEEVVVGTPIENYAKSLDKDKYDKIFSGLIKKGVNPKEIVSDVKHIKKKILGV